MKKILAILLAGLMIFSLCACKKGDETSSAEKVKEEIEEPIEETNDEVSDENKEPSTASEALTMYMESSAIGNGEAFFKLGNDPYKLNKMIADGGYSDEQALAAEIIEACNLSAEFYESVYGGNLIVDVEETKNVAFTDDEVAKINKYLETRFSYPADYMSELYVIAANVTYKGDKKSDTMEQELAVSKIDGEWYVNTPTPLYNEGTIRKILSE